eukprot:gene30518-35546_t
MQIVSTRVLVIFVIATFIGTMYSLSDLYSMSSQTALKADLRAEMESKVVVKAATASPPPVVVAEETKLGSGVAQTEASAIAAATSARKVFYYPNIELWGDVVKWGSENKATSSEDCCSQCKLFTPAKASDPPCNVFVFCGDKEKCKQQYGECWLKHLAHPEASKPSRAGPEVPWTAGTLDVDMNADPSKDRCTGSVGSTTTGASDDLMDELPTMVVDPLPKSMVENNWYVVLNRPYAFVQWAEKAKIPERFVLMAEPDHIMLRPLPNFMSGNRPASFPFFYIEPAKPEYKHIVEKFTGPMTSKQLEEIAPIGNSPTYLALEDMKRVMPVWLNVSIAIFKDKDASKVRYNK